MIDEIREYAGFCFHMIYVFEPLFGEAGSIHCAGAYRCVVLVADCRKALRQDILRGFVPIAYVPPLSCGELVMMNP